MILYYNLRMYYKNIRAIFSGEQDGPNNYVSRYSISYNIRIYWRLEYSRSRFLHESHKSQMRVYINIIYIMVAHNI